MRQLSEEENRERVVGEADLSGEEQGFGLAQELIAVLRQSLQGPQLWVLIASVAGILLGILFQTGLLWPLLFVGIPVAAVFLKRYMRGDVLAPHQQGELLVEKSPTQRKGLLASIVTLDDIQLLTGKQFEVLVAELMTCQGYTDVQVVGRSRDLCVDIKALGHRGEPLVVQCKRYSAKKKIVSKEMQAFYGMILHHGAQRGIYVTTSSYTKDARDLADSHAIELIDGKKLMQLITMHPPRFV